MPARPCAPAPPGGEPGRPSDGRSWLVAGLVPLPVLEFADPRSRVTEAAPVPEESRQCGECNGPVGRSYAGQPALVTGYCPRDRARFSFAPPKLHPDDRVAGRYVIIGYLARGGFGWVYLAEDRHLNDHRVVLKRMINATDPNRLASQLAELEHLISLDHPNIVRAWNFVTEREPDSGELTSYLVMEFLNGVSLHDIYCQARREDGDRLGLEDVLAYGHEILAALEYLHGRGLLYCDLKPDNVIRCGDRIRLIDLGGVRRIDDRDTPVEATMRYQVPEQEIREDGMSVGSDLYTVGTTLIELFDTTSDARAGADTLGGKMGMAIRSFERAMARATNQDREHRFGSAAEFAEQLRGVMREAVALRTSAEQPERSRLFAPTSALLDAGLGNAPPVTHWLRGDDLPVLDNGRPPGALAATYLPTPRVALDDRATRFLDASPEPASIIEKLAEFPNSVEIQLAGCRAHLALAQPDQARSCLEQAEERLGHDVRTEWRITWHRGLLALAAGDHEAARTAFDQVYSTVPGEIAPKLALGICAELGAAADPGPQGAEWFYRAVWDRDRSQTSAAFGLARTHLARGQREAAAEVLSAVPKTSRHYVAAQVAAVRVLSGQLTPEPAGLPDTTALRAAESLLASLTLDDGSHRRLEAMLRRTALARVQADGGGRLAGSGPSLGDDTDERQLRFLAEKSFHELSQVAGNPDEHGSLLDLANSIRPKTLL